MSNKEELITTAFVRVLRPMRHAWTVNEQINHPLRGSRREPDVLITEPKRHPVAIENKIERETSPNLDGEKQLKTHYIGKMLKDTGDIICTGISVRFPYRFRQIKQRDIYDEMKKADDIAYALLDMEKASRTNDSLPKINEPRRFPKEGWLTGAVADIANAIHIGTIPIERIEEASEILEHGIERAGALVDKAIAERTEIGKRIEALLYQEAGPQTTRMAMLIIGNAFIFQSALAGKQGLEIVPSLSTLHGQNGLLDSDRVLEGWYTIQAVNYHAIYDVAVNLVTAIALDDRLIGTVLSQLRSTALKLEQMGLAREHKLAGIVFQRLITDRRFIKAHYTRPEAATLLSALILPKLQRNAKQIKFADFACGTGSLLNGIYQRLGAFHEQAGGKGKEIHQYIVENNLVGCDILPNAVHLTASIIASTYPDIKIRDTRMHTMPYGIQQGDGKYAIGALDLLHQPENTFSIPLTSSHRVGGHCDIKTEARQEFKHGEFDIVIQNPPYTKGNTDGNTGVPKTTFGDKACDIEREMKKALKAQKGNVGDGNAGIASHFVELADKMLKRNGTLGVVLPINALTGTSWRKVRNLWAEKYQNLIAVTIAAAEIQNSTFSADTGIAECLVIATKGVSTSTGRGVFVCLHRRPAGGLDVLEIANQIHRIRDIRRLENGVTGGNPIKVGDETIGYAIDAPLPDAEAGWNVCRVKDIGIVQTAYQLAHGQLRLPRQTEAVPIPICRLCDIAETSPGPLDIYGDSGRGAFDIETGCPENTDYPCLWHVDAKTQVTMTVSPDAHALPRPNKEDKRNDIMKVNSRVHYNQSMRFNANALAVMFTEQKTIGINTLPNVAFDDDIYEYAWALWGNSTLGLLCHWMQCGKQQQGRGILGKRTLRSLPTLDVTRLGRAELETAARIFKALKHHRMRPFNEMVSDTVRQALDSRLLSDVLGFTASAYPEVHKGLALLRKKLCAEPSIDGGKKSRRTGSA